MLSSCIHNSVGCHPDLTQRYQSILSWTACWQFNANRGFCRSGERGKFNDTAEIFFGVMAFKSSHVPFTNSFVHATILRFSVGQILTLAFIYIWSFGFTR